MKNEHVKGSRGGSDIGGGCRWPVWFLFIVLGSMAVKGVYELVRLVISWIR